jgi:mannose-6-phosphate isomerase-like protein (cupin superfamily)
MTKYIYSQDDAMAKQKFGVDLVTYGSVTEDINFVRVSVKEGHFEEFKNTSWFVYYLIEGSGVFVLNDEKVEAKQGDVVSIPPNTRIHYFGKMELVLIVSPPWKAENETHIRDIDPSESPLAKENS